MKLLKPTWVNHNGKPMFSIDTHPDGTKFAAVGQGQDSGKVVIWNRSPVLQEDDEKDENIPKMLCQMDSHLACVNCVRWSNRGMYLVSGGDDKLIMIIEREGWKTNMDFVGHRKAVTVVKFNPKIFKKKQKNGSSAKPSCSYCCCAVGSKDRLLSIWFTCLKRPLVVIRELLDKSIMDISWTLNGLGILVCSMDGSVAFLDFSQDELGDPLSEEEKS